MPTCIVNICMQIEADAKRHNAELELAREGFRKAKEAQLAAIRVSPIFSFVARVERIY